jgi:hypothetical protein
MEDRFLQGGPAVGVFLIRIDTVGEEKLDGGGIACEGDRGIALVTDHVPVKGVAAFFVTQVHIGTSGDQQPHANQAGSFRGLQKRCLTFVVARVQFRAVFNQEPHGGRIAGLHESGVAEVIMGLDIGSAFQQNTKDLGIVVARGGFHEGCTSVVIGRVDVCAVSKQEPDHRGGGCWFLGRSADRRPLQGSYTPIAFGVDIRTMVQQQLYDAYETVVGGGSQGGISGLIPGIGICARG